MKKSSLGFSCFPAEYFGFTNQKKKGYFLVLVGTQGLETDFLNDFEKHRNIQKLRRIFEENNIRSVGLVREKDLIVLKRELHIICQKIDFKESHLVILLNYKSYKYPYWKETLPSEECFLTSTQSFFDAFSQNISTGLCYYFASRAVSKKSRLHQIIVHQIRHPNPAVYPSDGSPKNVEVVIPHKGNLSDLETALWHLQMQNSPPELTSVCFDEFVTENHFNLGQKTKNTRFFINLPTGIGPYPSRDILARATEKPIIVFHDSDDISTSDRIVVLVDYLKQKNLDAVGSQELQINTIEERVIAIRYPLNVNKSIFENHFMKIWGQIPFFSLQQPLKKMLS